MLKLYRFVGPTKEYWETWEEAAGSHIVHWGALGTRGSTKTIKSTEVQAAESIIQEEIDARITQGFQPVEPADQAILMVEYSVEGMGSKFDVEKRHRLEDRLNDILGWTGLGACDGGSMGSSTMEVCNFVVDFELAKKIIEKDLANTEFSNYSRIYDEDAE